MNGTRTEGSSLLALILAVIVLLVYRGPDSDGSSIAMGIAGLLVGAGITLAIVQWKFDLIVRRASQARERCDEIRDLLIAEQHALEEAERRPIPPIRMRANGDSEPADMRKTA